MCVCVIGFKRKFDDDSSSSSSSEEESNDSDDDNNGESYVEGKDGVESYK